jgi:ribose transport system ATP-binding protein
MRFGRSFCAAGGAIIFISHRMVEVMNHTDDVVIMRDGFVVGGGATQDLAETRIIEMMGMIQAPAAARVETRERATRVRVEEGRFLAHAGEVVGLAGLAGHGQREVLQRTFAGAARRHGAMKVHGSVAYVAGDRQTEGIFPLWSVARNISVGLKTRIARGGFIDLGREAGFADEWRKRFGIRVPSVETRITSLSGGNQQKVLVARAFAREADIVLLDDPLRGVDVGTKTELYAQVRRAADAGRCFIWYMTETAELENCDVVYTFYEGRITDVIPRAELTERRVLESSFGEASGHAA